MSVTSFKSRVSSLLGIVIPATGEDVEYRPKSGGVIKIKAVFDSEFLEVDPDTEALVSSFSPRIGVRLSDLQGKPAKGDSVIIIDSGKRFRVTDSQEDGQGGATLLLHKA